LATYKYILDINDYYVRIFVRSTFLATSAACKAGVKLFIIYENKA